MNSRRVRDEARFNVIRPGDWVVAWTSDRNGVMYTRGQVQEIEGSAVSVVVEDQWSDGDYESAATNVGKCAWFRLEECVRCDDGEATS